MIIIVRAGMYKQDLLQTTMCTITLWNIRGIKGKGQSVEQLL